MQNRLPILNEKQKQLLTQSMQMFDTHWDETAAMTLMEEDGVRFLSSRDTVFYALGLFLRHQPGDPERAVRCIRSVLSCQIIADGEVFDGTFRSMRDNPEPVRGMLDWKSMDPVTRYNLDIYYQRLSNALRRRMNAREDLRSLTPAVENELQAALRDVYPVVWQTYDPNWREFIVSTLQLILIHFERELPVNLVSDIDRACRRAVYAAVDRARTRFTPLNTNIRVMHVMMCDWFGRRWHDDMLVNHARAYAEELLLSYRQHHAVPEFNSPTYNGVVFTFIGFWRKYSPSETLHSLSLELEAGLWHDFAEFYNPAMRNVCGPYSRAYELEMTVHTALPAILYLTGALDELPPLSVETDCNPVLVLSDIRVPEDVLPLLREPRGERTVRHQFEELAERGDPRDNHALCTTTAWISDDLMLGAMSGSRNTSYQLHPAVAFWRNAGGSLSTVKLLRRTAEDELIHLHTVLFDVTAEAHRLTGTVRARAGRDIVPYFELEGPGLDAAAFTDDLWQVCGLTARCRFALNGRPAPWHTSRAGSVLRVCFPMRDGDELTFDMELTV